MEKFDICVIGGGPSGYAAVIRALDFNQKVILIEKEKLGGAGIHNGALASKSFWELSKEILLAQKTNKKYANSYFDVPFRGVVEEVHNAEDEREAQLESQLTALNKGEREGLLTYKKGTGSLVSINEVAIKNGETTETIWANHIILATGSRPRYLAEIPIDEDTIVTSDGLLNWEDYPESMVILGAGVIGCEYATIFSNLGKTKVYLIDKQPRILPFEDEDIARLVESNLQENGVHIHRNSRLLWMRQADGKVEYQLEYTDGTRKVFIVDKALCSVGRVPNIEGLGLETVGVEMDKRGHIVDDDSRTSIPNIYAVGDLTADLALVNVGELEGRHAIEKIMGKNPDPLDYSNISTIMFLNPETAGVGLNETQAKRDGIAYKVATWEFGCIPRAIAMRNTQGFFKILVSDDEEMRILGMRAIGEHASSAIQAVALLIHMKKGIEELAELIHPHPSIIEGVQECLRMLLGKSILKPSVFHELSCRRYCDGKYEEFNAEQVY